jgi:hypothetical protein
LVRRILRFSMNPVSVEFRMTVNRWFEAPFVVRILDIMSIIS